MQNAAISDSAYTSTCKVSIIYPLVNVWLMENLGTMWSVSNTKHSWSPGFQVTQSRYTFKLSFILNIENKGCGFLGPHRMQYLNVLDFTKPVMFQKPSYMNAESIRTDPMGSKSKMFIALMAFICVLWSPHSDEWESDSEVTFVDLEDSNRHIHFGAFITHRVNYKTEYTWYFNAYSKPAGIEFGCS